MTIGDGNAYDFVQTHKTFIDPGKTINGSRSLAAVLAKAHSRGKKYYECPDLVVELGGRCLKEQSGVCDHMSAAFVTKVVEHIEQGGRWGSPIELIGTEGHSFALVGRKDVPIRDFKKWGKRTITVDPWLGCLGAKGELADKLRGENGVFVGSEVLAHAQYFGEDDGSDLKVQCKLSVEELHNLAHTHSQA